MSRCPQCRRAVSKRERFCPHCWQALNPEAGGRRTVRWRSIAWAGGGVLGALALVLALVFFAPTPKRVFLMANYHWLKGAHFEVGRDLRTFAQVLERTAQSPSVTSLTLTAGVDSPQRTPSLAQIQQVLKGTSLSLVSQQDPAANKQAVSLRLNLAGSELLSDDGFASPEEFVLKVPMLDPRYLVVENHDLAATFAKLGIPYTGPDQVTMPARGQALTSQELGAILQDYGLYLTSSIRDDEFTMERGVAFEPPHGGAPVKLDRVTLHLSESRVKEILKGLGQKLQSDQNLQALLTAAFRSSMQVGGASPSLDEAWRATMERWNQGVDSLQLPDGLTVELLVDKGDRLVQETISTRLASGGEAVPFRMTLTDWVTAAGRDQILSMVIGNPNLEVKFEGSTKTEIRSIDETHTLGSYLVSVTEKGKQTLSLSVAGDTTATRVDGGAKDRVTRDYFLLVDDGTRPMQGELRLSTYGSGRADGDRYENAVDLAVTASDGTNQGTVRLHGDLEVDFTKSPQFPNLTGSNVLNLTTATKEDMEELRQNLTNAMGGFRIPMMK